MVRRARLITSALLAGLLALPATAAAAPTIGGFSARPVALNGKEVAAPFFSVDAAPGSSATLEILVANASKTTLRLHVDPVDAATSATSGIAYRNRTEPIRKAGGWLRAPKQVLRWPQAISARSARSSRSLQGRRRGITLQRSRCSA